MCTIITGEVDSLEEFEELEMGEVLIAEKKKDDGRPQFWFTGMLMGVIRNGGELDLGDGWFVKFNLTGDKFTRIQLCHRGAGNVGKSTYQRTKTKIEKVEVIKKVKEDGQTEIHDVNLYEHDDEEEEI